MEIPNQSNPDIPDNEYSRDKNDFGEIQGVSEAGGYNARSNGASGPVTIIIIADQTGSTGPTGPTGPAIEGKQTLLLNAVYIKPHCNEYRLI